MDVFVSVLNLFVDVLEIMLGNSLLMILLVMFIVYLLYILFMDLSKAVS